VFAFEKIRRQETKNCFTGSVHDDATGHHLSRHVLGEVGRVEFEAEHESVAANVDDDIVLCGETREFGVKVVSGFANVIEEIAALNRVDNRNGYGAGEWASPEGGAVHAGGESCGGRMGAEHRAHGDAVGDGLRQSDNVGLNAVVLIGEPFAGAAHTGLYFVG
jgi:hypothetical protein